MMMKLLTILLISFSLLLLACSDEDDGGTVVGPDDFVLPSTIDDFEAINSTGSIVNLRWTSPGDDGIAGKTRVYDIRYSTSTITDSTWETATAVTGEPAPKVVGYEETFTVSGLDAMTIYYFAIKAADEAANWSELSNIASISTLMAGNWTLYNTSNSELANDTILAICLDGGKYFGTPIGMAELDGGAWEMADVVEEDSIVNPVTDVAADNSGAVWAATQADGLTKIEGQLVTRVTDSTTGLTSDAVTSIVIADNGDLWIGTNGGGICLLAQGFLWTAYNTETSNLVFNGINQLALDNNGSLWAATNVGGVSKLVGDNFVNYNSSDCPPLSSVWAIAFDAAGNGWFGTNGGVCKFDGTSWTTYTTSDGLVSNVITAIAVAPSGDIWAGTWGGLCRFDGTDWITYRTENSELPDNLIRTIVPDAGGNIWIATDRGIAIFHD